MTRTILTFGDSNSHGTPPMANYDHHPRLARRWPVVMAETLGCALIEDGLPGRTACPLPATSPDLHLDGHLGMRMAVAAHGPIDHMIIMLGTNDLQTKYGHTPASVAAGLAGLLAMARDPMAQARHDGFSLTVISPPPISEVGTFVPGMLWGGDKSLALPRLFQELAAAHGATYLDAAEHIAVSPIDGVHFDADAHQTLGEAVASHLQDVLAF